MRSYSRTLPLSTQLVLQGRSSGLRIIACLRLPGGLPSGILKVYSPHTAMGSPGIHTPFPILQHVKTADTLKYIYYFHLNYNTKSTCCQYEFKLLSWAGCRPFYTNTTKAAANDRSERAERITTDCGSVHRFLSVVVAFLIHFLNIDNLR
jgi:ribosomal protein L31